MPGMSRKKLGIALAVWDTAWKAIAIMVATRNRQMKWVPVLTIVNSAGILPMVYLWKFSGPRLDDDLDAEPAA